MGSQPIRIQLGKILRENLVGNSCGKILQEILVGNSCGKILQEISKYASLLQKKVWEMLWEMLQKNIHS